MEVWDYDMEENLRQRIGKVSDIKDLKGITRYMKEVAKGKSHDTLGHVQVHLKVSWAGRTAMQLNRVMTYELGRTKTDDDVKSICLRLTSDGVITRLGIGPVRLTDDYDVNSFNARSISDAELYRKTVRTVIVVVLPLSILS